MKVCMFQRSSFLGNIQRLGIFFNETTIIDVKFVWLKVFEDQGRFNAIEMAGHKAPSSLAKVLKIYQENTIDFLQETQEHYIQLSKKGILKTSFGGELAFDLRDDKSAKLNCPIDKINCYRDFYAHEKHVAKGF